MRRSRGFGIYILVILAVLAVYYYMSVSHQQVPDMTWSKFEEEIEENNVLTVIISQNAQTPTGTLKVTLEGDDDNVFEVNVPDVTKAQKLMDDNDFTNYYYLDVPI